MNLDRFDLLASEWSQQTENANARALMVRACVVDGV